MDVWAVKEKHLYFLIMNGYVVLANAEGAERVDTEVSRSEALVRVMRGRGAQRVDTEVSRLTLC